MNIPQLINKFKPTTLYIKSFPENTARHLQEHIKKVNYPVKKMNKPFVKSL
jgi:hypothetical protein